MKNNYNQNIFIGLRIFSITILIICFYYVSSTVSPTSVDIFFQKLNNVFNVYKVYICVYKCNYNYNYNW